MTEAASPASEADADRSDGRVYGGKSPAARRADRRRRLIDAGVECFAATGYPATTIQQLCLAASVAPGKFYEAFASREELLMAVCAEIMADVDARVVAAVDAAEGSFDGQARAGLHAFCHAMLDDPRRARVVLIESVGVSPAVERERRGAMDQNVALITEYARLLTEAAGARFELTPQLATMVRALVGGVNEVIVNWLHEPDPPPLDDIIDWLGDIFGLVSAEIGTPDPARGRGPDPGAADALP